MDNMKSQFPKNSNHFMMIIFYRKIEFKNRKNMKTLKIIPILFIALLSSCVSQKKYTTLQDKATLCENELKTSNNERLC